MRIVNIIIGHGSICIRALLWAEGATKQVSSSLIQKFLFFIHYNKQEKEHSNVYSISIWKIENDYKFEVAEKHK